VPASPASDPAQSDRPTALAVEEYHPVDLCSHLIPSCSQPDPVRSQRLSMAIWTGLPEDERLAVERKPREDGAHVDTPSRFSLPWSQATALAKARWISSQMMSTLPPSLFVQSGALAGDTTSTDPRSRRIRGTRKRRPCNELGLSA
jgi:hypothetical protein